MPSGANSAMNAHVVTCDWLNQHLDDANLVIVDCRFNLMQPDQGRSQYELSHLPQAHYLHLNHDLSSPVQAHGGRHPLPDLVQFTQTLRALGLNQDSQVVVYDDSRLAFAARLWWLLRYVGHPTVAVLEGGFSQWQTLGYPVTRAIPYVVPGDFTARVQSDWVVDIDQVKARQNLPQVALVDSREPARYRGETEPIDPVAGHIPGAVNFPWQDVTDAQGLILQDAQRWAALRDKAEIIVYCGSGVTACVNLLSLELAGMPSGKLYAGSWSDWCSYL